MNESDKDSIIVLCLKFLLSVVTFGIYHHNGDKSSKKEEE